MLFEQLEKTMELLLTKYMKAYISYNGLYRVEEYLFPEAVGQLNEPYVEVGFGIENIFKISRVDFTWRLNYTDKPDVYYFIAKPSFQFKF